MTGISSTTIVFVLDTGVQAPPVVVNLRVAVPKKAGGGVQIAFNVVADGLNVPPEAVDHIPPVAPPPIEPPRTADVPPWQIDSIDGPRSTI